MHSPHTEQAIVCGSGQEVEAVAVGGSRGGEAQGRHSSGVSCEPLQGATAKQADNLKDNLLRRPHCLVYTGQCRFFSSTFIQKTDHFKETHPVNLLGVQVPHLDHLTG